MSRANSSDDMSVLRPRGSNNASTTSLAHTVPSARMGYADYLGPKSSSGGSIPRSRGSSYSPTNYSYFKSNRASSRGTVIAKTFRNRLHIGATPTYLSPFDVAAPVNASYLPMPERTEAEQLMQQHRLQIARARYVQSLKKKIFNGDSPRQVQEPGGPPNIYNAIETAADRRANNLFLFPDTDPAVYRRQINIPNTFSHQPVFGF